MAERTSASPVTRDAAIEKVRLAEALPAPQRATPSGHVIPAANHRRWRSLLVVRRVCYYGPQHRSGSPRVVRPLRQP
jgi:hypothetical protein